jgi:hypothetical protein
LPLGKPGPKLAGEYGDATAIAEEGVCGISPVMELAECVHALERGRIVSVEFRSPAQSPDAPEGRDAPGRVSDCASDRVRTVRVRRVFHSPHFL